jgi:integrase
MNLRQRYQYGCLTRMRRSRGEDIWQFRFYETTKEGQRQRRARTIGTIAQYPTRADALRAIEPFRHRLNQKHRFARPPSIRALADLYVEQELPRLRYSTQRSYLSVLTKSVDRTSLGRLSIGRSQASAGRTVATVASAGSEK